MDRSRRRVSDGYNFSAPNGPKTPSERQALLSFQRYSYSINSNDAHHNNGSSIASHSNDSSRLQQAKAYFSADVSTRWADLILLICFFMSGLVDSGAYNAYECFTSMQTGNTVFAALGVSNLPLSAPRLAYLKSVTAIVSFMFGAGLISVFHRNFGSRKRWVIVASFSSQALLTVIAAVLVTNGKSSESPARPLLAIAISPDNGDEGVGFPLTDLIPIALLSFQAAGKVVASRVLEQNALPAVVLTTLYNDLMSDPELLTAGLMSNVQRNRRLGGVMFYFGGAVLGGALARSTLGFAGALWFAVGIKICLVGAWLLWREEQHEMEGEE